MIVIAVDFGQPWSEAKAMSDIERKSFLYGAYLQRGYQVDWKTGKIRQPPKNQP